MGPFAYVIAEWRDRRFPNAPNAVVFPSSVEVGIRKKCRATRDQVKKSRESSHPWTSAMTSNLYFLAGRLVLGQIKWRVICVIVRRVSSARSPSHLTVRVRWLRLITHNGCNYWPTLDIVLFLTVSPGQLLGASDRINGRWKIMHRVHTHAFTTEIKTLVNDSNPTTSCADFCFTFFFFF